jgi:capsid assembly protein
LPETAWDTTTGVVKLDALQPIVTAHQAELTRRSSLPQKPDDYKIELPGDFKLEGVKPEDIKIDEKDARIPLVRAFAHEFGLPQAAVSKLVALDTQVRVAAARAAEAAETARITEETKKLGANADDRLKAVGAWATGLKQRAEISDDEVAAIYQIATSAAGVTLLEKLITKSNGQIPGNTPPNPAPTPPKTHAERMWPQGFATRPAAKAS